MFHPGVRFPVSTVHLSFVTMAAPPMGKGGDCDFSVFNALL